MTEEDYKITKKIIKTATITVPYEKGRITFVSPAKDPETYVHVKEKIESEGLVTPTMAQMASLVHVANRYPNEEEFMEIFDKFCKGFWTFNGILYVKNKGAYIQDNPEIKNGMVFLEESELIKKLESGDKSVRFVPFGYNTVEVRTPYRLARNPFVIGLAGEEGAEKLAEVSERYPEKVQVWSYDFNNETRSGAEYEKKIKIASLGSLYTRKLDRRLDICGVNFNCDNKEPLETFTTTKFAFGMVKG